MSPLHLNWPVWPWRAAFPLIDSRGARRHACSYVCVAQEEELVVVQVHSGQQRLLHAAPALVHPPPVCLRADGGKGNLFFFWTSSFETAFMPAHWHTAKYKQILMTLHIFRQTNRKKNKAVPWTPLLFLHCPLYFPPTSSYLAPAEQNTHRMTNSFIQNS